MEKTQSNEITNNLLNISHFDSKELFEKLNSSEKGLSEEDAVVSQEKNGLNTFSKNKISPWWKNLFDAFSNPFNYVLVGIAIVSFFSDVLFNSDHNKNWNTVIVISSMVILSVGIRFLQEFKSSKAEEALKNLIRVNCSVEREGIIKEIDIKDLAVGDIVHLAAGDMIPADLRILSSKDLFVSQSSFTGESEPVEKFSFLSADSSNSNTPFLKDNICLLGSNVLSGTGIGIVISVGDATYFGLLSSVLLEKKVKTSFEIGIDSVASLLVKFMLVMVPIVFLINGFTKGSWLEAFLFSITVAVGLTPEMLPMIVTTNLAKGAIALSKKKVIVKRLDAIQNFGAMDIFCTDKTGTLTLDKIVLQRYLDINGEESLEILKYGYLNSAFQTGLKNLMDHAIIDKASSQSMDQELKSFKKVDEIPFDFTRKRMSVIIEDSSQKKTLIIKGSLDEMLSVSKFYLENNELKPIDSSIMETIKKEVTLLAEDGMRVILLGRKEIISDQTIFEPIDEKDIVLMGYMAFLDPPKESAIEAIASLRESGVLTKVLTGDNEIITKKICRDVGINETHVLTGPEISNMTDNELTPLLIKTTIFAKLTPDQKARIIRLLRAEGHVVGFMGDGINDTPALKEADVGISVDTAVDIAKETADIILLEKSLMVLTEGVLEGRKIFGNIIKYIKMTASSNFGNVFSVLVASVFLPFVPMLPIQLLTQNFLYDLSQTSIPWDTMDNDFLEKPRKWETNDIAKFMLYIGPLSSIFDIITFLVLWYIFKANSPAQQSLFQTGWFLEGLLSQTLIIHAIRTKKIPFIESRATNSVLFTTTLIAIIGILITLTPIKNYIGLTTINNLYFIYLFFILLGYLALVQFVKRYYIKKFNSWL